MHASFIPNRNSFHLPGGVILIRLSPNCINADKDINFKGVNSNAHQSLFTHKHGVEKIFIGLFSVFTLKNYKICRYHIQLYIIYIYVYKI